MDDTVNVVVSEEPVFVCRDLRYAYLERFQELQGV